jgi:integration host factor subunit alpha
MAELTITRSEISEKLAKALSIPKQKANGILDFVLKEMIESLVKDGELKLSSFGSFMVRQKKTRVGRNPKTGIEVMITPRKSISFRPSHLLKEKVIHGSLKAMGQPMRVAG